VCSRNNLFRAASEYSAVKSHGASAVRLVREFAFCLSGSSPSTTASEVRNKGPLLAGCRISSNGHGPNSCTGRVASSLALATLGGRGAIKSDPRDSRKGGYCRWQATIDFSAGRKMLMALPVVLIPGLIASPRLYAAQLPALWRIGPVTVADHTRHESVADCARHILADAPPRFALAGHSFGGYLAFEILRQSPSRVVALALLDTSARADTPEQSDKRREQIAMARKGPFSAVAALQFPAFVHPSRANDSALRRYMRAMADDNDADVFMRQQTAMIGRPDSRDSMADISCPTVVVVGDADTPTPPERAREIAAGIAGARLVTIRESGHMTPIEKPLAVTDTLAAHFAAVA